MLAKRAAASAIMPTLAVEKMSGLLQSMPSLQRRKHELRMRLQQTALGAVRSGYAPAVMQMKVRCGALSVVCRHLRQHARHRLRQSLQIQWFGENAFGAGGRGLLLQQRSHVAAHQDHRQAGPSLTQPARELDA